MMLLLLLRSMEIGVRTDDEEHLGGAAAVAAVEEPDALPLVAIRVPVHLAVRHCCSPPATLPPPPPGSASLLVIAAARDRLGFDRLGVLGNGSWAGWSWKPGIEK